MERRLHAAQRLAADPLRGQTERPLEGEASVQLLRLPAGARGDESAAAPESGVQTALLLNTGRELGEEIAAREAEGEERIRAVRLGLRAEKPGRRAAGLAADLPPLQEAHAQAQERRLARDRETDDPAAHDEDVVDPFLIHVRRSLSPARGCVNAAIGTQGALTGRRGRPAAPQPDPTASPCSRRSCTRGRASSPLRDGEIIVSPARRAGARGRGVAILSRALRVTRAPPAPRERT